MLAVLSSLGIKSEVCTEDGIQVAEFRCGHHRLMAAATEECDEWAINDARQFKKKFPERFKAEGRGKVTFRNRLVRLRKKKRLRPR